MTAHLLLQPVFGQMLVGSCQLHFVWTYGPLKTDNDEYLLGLLIFSVVLPLHQPTQGNSHKESLSRVTYSLSASSVVSVATGASVTAGASCLTSRRSSRRSSLAAAIADASVTAVLVRMIMLRITTSL